MKVAIYLRKSRDDECDDALANHRNKLIELCDKNNYQYEIFNDGIITGDSFNERPALQKMLKSINQFSLVAVTEISRLARNQEYLHRIANILLDANVQIIDVHGSILDLNNPQDEMMYGINSTLARMEWRLAKQRLSIGRVEAAKKGFFSGGTPLYGYSAARRQNYKINPVEAEIVCDMFNLYAQGYSQSSIAEHLNARGIKTRKGCKWSGAAISQLLKNECYIGRYRATVTNFKNETESFVISDAHEPIIEKELFYKVNDLIKVKDKAKSPTRVRGGKVHNILAGLTFCANCGMKLTIRPRRGNLPPYLQKCVYKDCFNEDGSSNAGMTLHLVIDIFWERFTWLQQYHNKVFTELLELPQDVNKTEKLENELEQLKQHKQKLQNRHDKVSDAFFDGDIDKNERDRQFKRIKSDIQSTLARINTVNDLIETARNELDEMKSKIEVLNRISAVRDKKLEQHEIEEVNRLLRLVIKKIYFKKYKTTHSESGLEQETVELAIIPVAQDPTSPVTVID